MELSQLSATITDEEVIDRILAGEKEVYEVIVRRYNSYLYRVGRVYGFNHDDTEDLMQETYVSAFMHLRNFEHRSTFKTWIVRIMLNQCYHKKQKAANQAVVTDSFGSERQGGSVIDNLKSDIQETASNHELKEVLETAVQNIPIDYRIVFTLREMNGMSVRQTAEALNISESNVKVRLNRAKGMLRNEIRKVYSPEEIFEFNLIYCDGMVERVLEAVSELEIS